MIILKLHFLKNNSLKIEVLQFLVHNIKTLIRDSQIMNPLFLLLVTHEKSLKVTCATKLFFAIK